MDNARLKHAIGERSARHFLGWVAGLGIALTTAGINSAWGQQSTWKGAGGTPANPKGWKDPANWDNVPPVGGAAGYTLNFTGQNNAFVSSNNLQANFSFGNLVLSTTFTGNNNGLTGEIIQGSSLFGSGTMANPIPTIQQNGNGTFNILNTIDWGTSGITLSGSGNGIVNFGKATDPTVGILTGAGTSPLVVNSTGNASFYMFGNNNYTGGTTVKAGTLVIGNSTNAANNTSAIGRGTLTLSGGTIRAAEGLGGQVLNNAVTIDGNTTIGAKVTGLTQKDTLTLAGATTLANNPTITVAAQQANGAFVTSSLNGVISGNSGFTKSGTSILSLGGKDANTYTGTTTVSQGTLILAKDANVVAVPGNLVIGNGISTGQTVTLVNDGQIKDTSQVTMYSGTTLDLGNKTQTIGSLGDTPKGGGGNVIIGTGTLTTGSASSTTFSGTFTGGAGGTLVKTGNTAFTLTGKSTDFTGTVKVDQGKLTLNNAQLGSKMTPLKLVEVANQAVLNGTKGTGNKNLNIWANKVTVDPGGKMAPGMSPGILGVGASLDLQPGSHFGIVLAGTTPGDGPGHYAQLDLVGGGTIQGSILDLALESAPTLDSRYTIIENFNSDFGSSDVTPLTGIFYNEAGSPLANGSEIYAAYGSFNYGFEVQYNQNASGYDVVLTDVSATAVPEPSSFVLLALGVTATFAVAARRRSRFGASCKPHGVKKAGNEPGSAS
jgi:autotransporter-associated beta strand protein